MMNPSNFVLTTLSVRILEKLPVTAQTIFSVKIADTVSTVTELTKCTTLILYDDKDEHLVILQWVISWMIMYALERATQWKALLLLLFEILKEQTVLRA